MALLDSVRSGCAEIAAGARWVRIDRERLEAVEPDAAPGLDPASHFLEGEAGDVAAYLLTLDSINFGSGWFPTLRKRPGMSGYFTVASALADHWRAEGPWSPDDAADGSTLPWWPRCWARTRATS